MDKKTVWKEAKELLTGKIEVTYDGEYPNSCSGTLTIKINGDIIYSKAHCCHSTGSVSFTPDWEEVVTGGSLIWDDADDFNDSIQKAVEDVLSEVYVCCGGCV
jgi:hypothetical protein